MSPEQMQQRSSPGTRSSQRPLADVSTVAVVGLGYVGLPLAIRAASKGFNVVGFDIDEVKVIQLARREANFLSDEENDLFARSSLLHVTSDEKELDTADAYLICVPTPVYENHLPDLRPLEGASRIVGRHLKRGDLVVVESTVSPGVCEGISLKILCEESGLSASEFDFAHCPERINPGDENWDVRSIPRVMGGLTPRSLERAASLYSRIVEGNILRMNSIKEAEAVKMVENAFRDINIAFVNELAISFDRAGIDIVNVIKGASTKPFGFMAFYPGCGVGGHCIPVDPYYLIRYGRENGFEHKFLITARRVNSQMPLYAVDILERTLKEQGRKLTGAKVALLGLAYKRDIPDVRESPALIMRDALTRAGAEVRTYDPHALGGNVRTLTDAMRGADAAIIATDHAELRALTPQQFESFGIRVVVDGRNCLQKEEFVGSPVIYRGIGRGGV